MVETNKQKQIDGMEMRSYEELSDISIPKEQEKMMNIICKAWEDCLQNDCTNCVDRPKKYMRIVSCSSLKYTRLLLENGYREQSEVAKDILLQLQSHAYYPAETPKGMIERRVIDEDDVIAIIKKYTEK